jgi:hypothetical protein
MKNLLIALLTVLSLSCFAENNETYKASNGKTYQIGDTIKLGRGSSHNGRFIYLQMGGMYNAMVAMGGSNNVNTYSEGLSGSLSGLNLIVKKIKTAKLKGATKTFFVVGGGNITNYNLMIEDAIASCEIVDCIEKVQKVEMINKPSKADEIKKLKDLLDSGAITKDEFDVEKKKILDK